MILSRRLFLEAIATASAAGLLVDAVSHTKPSHKKSQFVIPMISPTMLTQSPIFKKGLRVFQSQVNLISGGDIEISFVHENHYVYAGQFFKHFRSGDAQIGLFNSSFWEHQFPELALFSGLPGGLKSHEKSAWIKNDETQALWDILMAKKQFKPLFLLSTPDDYVRAIPNEFSLDSNYKVASKGMIGNWINRHFSMAQILQMTPEQSMKALSGGYRHVSDSVPASVALQMLGHTPEISFSKDLLCKTGTAMELLVPTHHWNNFGSDVQKVLNQATQTAGQFISKRLYLLQKNSMSDLPLRAFFPDQDANIAQAIRENVLKEMTHRLSYSKEGQELMKSYKSAFYKNNSLLLG